MGFLTLGVFLFPGNSPASFSDFFFVSVIWFDSTWIPLEMYGDMFWQNTSLENSHVGPKNWRWMEDDFSFEKTGDVQPLSLGGCTNRTLHVYLMKNAWISTPRAMPPNTAVF